MKKLLPVVVLFCLVAPAGAAKRVGVSSLPEPVRAFAETETNVAFSVGATTNSTWKQSDRAVGHFKQNGARHAPEDMGCRRILRFWGLC